MTREEAKHIVDVAFSVPQAVRRDGEDRTYHEDEIREAKNMAIQALSQEPCDKCKYFDGNSCQHYDYKVGYTQGYEDASKRFRQEPCDDAISREAVMKIVDEEWLCNADYDFRSLVEALEQLPSVTHKSGKWIINRLIPDKHQCSECGMYIWVSKEEVEEGIKLPNYCSNCGARMVEPQERSE